MAAGRDDGALALEPAAIAEDADMGAARCGAVAPTTPLRARARGGLGALISSAAAASPGAAAAPEAPSRLTVALDVDETLVHTIFSNVDDAREYRQAEVRVRAPWLPATWPGGLRGWSH